MTPRILASSSRMPPKRALLFYAHHLWDNQLPLLFSDSACKCAHCGHFWPHQVTHVHTHVYMCNLVCMSCAQKVRNHSKIGQVPCADTQGISTRVVMEGVHIIRHACTLYNTCSNVPARAVFADAEVLPRATSSMLPVIHSFKPRYKSICI